MQHSQKVKEKRAKVPLEIIDYLPIDNNALVIFTSVFLAIFRQAPHTCRAAFPVDRHLGIIVSFLHPRLCIFVSCFFSSPRISNVVWLTASSHFLSLNNSTVFPCKLRRKHERWLPKKWPNVMQWTTGGEVRWTTCRLPRTPISLSPLSASRIFWTNRRWNEVTQFAERLT